MKLDELLWSCDDTDLLSYPVGSFSNYRCRCIRDQPAITDTCSLAQQLYHPAYIENTPALDQGEDNKRKKDVPSDH